METFIAWALFIAILGVGLSLVAYTMLRATVRGRRFLGLPLRAKLRFGRLLLTDRETPLIARVLLMLLVVYLALPFDLIPDFIPVAGQLDDFLIVVLAVSALLLLIPRERFTWALDEADAGQPFRDAGGNVPASERAPGRQSR